MLVHYLEYFEKMEGNFCTFFGIVQFYCIEDIRVRIRVRAKVRVRVRLKARIRVKVSVYGLGLWDQG